MNPSPAKQKPASMTPPNNRIQIRRPHFDFSKDHRIWFRDDPLKTHFFNAISMSFPAEERYYVNAVAHFRNSVQDPVLRREVATFSGQEGLHSVEHHKYNVAAAGEETAVRHERICMAVPERISSPHSRLLFTVCQEHLTAILGDLLLLKTDWLERMEEQHRLVWTWHALEEVEHKGVSFDVYRSVGGSYLQRLRLLPLATFWWFAVTLYLTGVYLWRDNQLFKLRTLRSFLELLRAMARGIPHWLAFLRPGFHPWMNDNSVPLEAWKLWYTTEMAQS